MNSAIKAALGLVVAVAVLGLLLPLTGLHTSNPVAAGLAFIIPAIVLNIAAVVWALMQTRHHASYLGQLAGGAVIGVVAGALIFGFTLLLLNMVYPEHLAESKEAMVTWVQSNAAMTDAQKQMQLEANSDRTPVSEGMGGLIGTIATSVIVAAIAGIFLRKK